MGIKTLKENGKNNHPNKRKRKMSIIIKKEKYEYNDL